MSEELATIRAFHNDLTLKAEAVERMRAHAKADALVQGTYINGDLGAPGGYRGCFIGCLVAEIDPQIQATLRHNLEVGGYHGECNPDDDLHEIDPACGWHEAAQRLLGINSGFGMLADRIFETLPTEETTGFAMNLVRAIPVGADLAPILDQIVIAILVNPEHGIQRHLEKIHPEGTVARDVADLLARTPVGEGVPRSESQILRQALEDLRSDRRHPGVDAFRSAMELALNERRRPVGIYANARNGITILNRSRNVCDQYARWVADLLIQFTCTAGENGSVG